MHFSPFGSQCVFGQHPFGKLHVINKEPTLTVYYLSNLFIPKTIFKHKIPTMSEGFIFVI